MKFTVSDFCLKHPVTDKCMIEELNLTAHTGDIIGISGNNGSGKTLFLDSIFQKYNNWTGKILLDNTVPDIRSITYLLQFRKRTSFSENVSNEIKFYLQNIKTEYSYEMIIDLLNEFGFDYNTLKNISLYSLSESEYAVLSFVLSIIRPVNLVLIDEIDSNFTKKLKTKFIKFLNFYRSDKIIVIVSHDKDFLNSISKTIVQF